MRIIARHELPALVWQITQLMSGQRPARDVTESNFVQYHKENPHVYAWFDKYCQMALDAGKKDCSAWYIVNGLRWEAYIKAADSNSEFTICNNYISLYARWWMERNPKLHDWFGTKLRDVEQVIVDQLGAEVESRAKVRNKVCATSSVASAATKALLAISSNTAVARSCAHGDQSP